MMPKEWFQRLWLVLFVVIGSLYLLVPTFFWHPANEGRVGEVASATPTATAGLPSLLSPSGQNMVASASPAVVGSSGVASAPGWMSAFPNKRLRFGLDLVGGSHLALGVDTDEALRAMIGGERRDVRERLTKEGIPFEAVTQPFGTAQLQVVLKSASDHSALTDLITTKIDRRLEEQGFSADKDGKGIATYGFTGNQVEQIRTNAVNQVLELLRSRTNTFGVSEPRIYPETANRIVVELPALKDPAQAIENIKRTARLEFRIVDEDWYNHTPNAEVTLESQVAQAVQSLPPAEQDDDGRLNLALRGKIPPEDVVFFERTPDPKTKKMVRTRPYLLKGEVALTGDRLDPSGIFPEQDKFGKWEVALKFDTDGAERFAKITGENVQKRMAVILEGAVQTAPVIQDKIEGGSAVITLGNRNQPDAAKDAANIARVLRTGALPAPVRIEQSQVVGPELGQDSIRRGIEASVLGFTLVFLFAWYWYRWSGFIATIALVANAVVMLSLMTLFDATLTLPGIAGIVLTTGMAVDANVLIYERIREELRLGKTIRSAIEVGFDRAFWTVVDSHMTTALAGVVLYLYGTDQIKGFAVTLLLGIATSLFTALIISRLCFDYWTMKIKPQELSI